MAIEVWVATAPIYLNNVRAYNEGYVVPDSVVTTFGLEAEDLVERRMVDSTGAPEHGSSHVTDAELTAALAGKVNASDPRLADTRAPKAHAASHAPGGTDPVTPAAIGALEATQLGVAVAGVGNGVADDTTALQAALTAGAGGMVRGRPGKTYLISAPLVVSSGTTLDMTGCTIRLKAASGVNMLQNAAVVATGTRDSNIVVRGGLWDRGANGGTDTGNHTLRFRRVDGLVVSDLKVVSTNGKYSVNLGDVNDFTVERVRFDVFSDGVHVNGPATRGLIRDIKGTTGDDLVALTATDYASYNDVSGDITDIRIEDLYGDACQKALVKLLAGPTTRILRVAVDGVRGDTPAHLVGIGDPATGTTALEMADISFRNLHPSSCAYIANIGNETIRDIRFDDVSWPSTAAGAMIRVGNPCTIGRLSVSAVRATNSSTSLNVVDVSGTVGDLIIDDVHAAFADTTGGRVLALQGSGSIARLSASNIHVVNGAELFWLTPGTGGGEFKLSNVNATGCNLLAHVYGSGGWDVQLSNVTTSPVTSMFRVQNAAVAVLRGNNIKLTGTSISRASHTGTLSVKGLSLPVDLTQVPTRTTGDTAFNTNAALSCGAGPVVSDGTSWKNLYTGLTY